MLRIIDMREATSGKHAFAVWNTVTDTFLCVDGEQCWDGFAEFADSATRDLDVDRVRALLPAWAIASDAEPAT
jgi:hypothetical protein